MYDAFIVMTLAFVLLLGVRRILPHERGVIVRSGKRMNQPVGPGFVLILPFVDKLDRVPMEPFSVSLPPQSAITKDEIPIQLQASLDALVRDPVLASTVRDWRVSLMSQLQDLMKEQLEEFEFDNLDTAFPEWIGLIQTRMNKKAAEIGVEIMHLQISNLSPRTKPG